MFSFNFNLCLIFFYEDINLTDTFSEAMVLFLNSEWVDLTSLLTLLLKIKKNKGNVLMSMGDKCKIEKGEKYNFDWHFPNQWVPRKNMLQMDKEHIIKLTAYEIDR